MERISRPKHCESHSLSHAWPPASKDEKPHRSRAQAGKGTANLTACPQCFEREGRLKGPAQVPRKHVVLFEDGRERRLGAWVNNQRSSAGALAPERMEQLSEVGVRWS
ncbi:helicase associated domain-containing protein [Streptomyces sp. NBC_00102]|uniref:helicase associated domain-containing protein n=1 Tax=Streptomyces sp. NBC_00102 TaxID=2975652 RepID=UPI0022528D66|nr:helicase associated domain-containing protein [Streptomyces sp. NBC_00102]MCX5401326.1 helicase associated domain-containing protein [Streptomyces sp. NBC_00102]